MADPSSRCGQSHRDHGTEWHEDAGALGRVGPTNTGLRIPSGAALAATEVCPGLLSRLEPQKMLLADNLWPSTAVNLHAGGMGHNIEIYHVPQRQVRRIESEEFSELSQLASYEAQRAMFEAFVKNRDTATGVVQWMLNNSWPSIIWHLYDYYMRPGGGFYGTQAACKPLHVMFATDDRSVVVSNERRNGADGLRVKARALSLELEELFSTEVELSVAPRSTTPATVIPSLTELSSAYFLDLRLEDGNGELLDRNFCCWRPPRPNEPGATRYYTPVTKAPITARKLPGRSGRASLRGETMSRLQLSAAWPLLQARLAMSGAGISPVL